MRLRPTLPAIVLCCIGILIAITDDQASCEVSQGNETIQLLQAEEADTVSFQQQIYFTGPNGGETVAHIGTYRVQAVAFTALRLIPFGNKAAFVIKAEETRHEEDIASPVALLVTDEMSLVHVVLLLPEHKGLEAMGSANPDRSRGSRRLLKPTELHEAFMQKRTGSDLRAP